MINILSDYIEKSVPEVLTTAKGLLDKVDATGKLLPFPGNTVVFLLDLDTKVALQRVQERLHRMCGDMLAEPLEMSTFHVTLHDLANGQLLDRQEDMAAQAKIALEEIRAAELPPIPMKATWTFNMVSTSIVLGLEPDGTEAWGQLDRLYERFQQIRPLSYALTPHITMAYFRPGVYEDTTALAQAMGPVNLKVTLEINDLVLQNFDHMNAYYTVY